MISLANDWQLASPVPGKVPLSVGLQVLAKLRAGRPPYEDMG